MVNIIENLIFSSRKSQNLSISQQLKRKSDFEKPLKIFNL